MPRCLPEQTGQQRGRFLSGALDHAAIFHAIAVLIASVTGLLFIKDIVWFFLIGFIAGFSLSGAQAVSRSMVSQLAPVEQSAEFFGFLSVAGRTSTFVGPLVFSTISFRMHNWYITRGVESTLAEQYGLLWAIGSIAAFLVCGMHLLLLVKRISVNNGDS